MALLAVAALSAPMTGSPSLGDTAVPAGAALFGRAGAVDPAALARGKLIVSRGGGGGVTACSACHGLDGAGDGSGAFPRLTGSPAFYGLKQLRDYKSGTRRNAIMGPIAAAMTAEQMRDASLWYVQARADLYPADAADLKVLARGAELASVGDLRLGVGGCARCHGPEGAAVAPSMPPLAGQFANYAEYQFDMWRRDERRNDLGGSMRNLAHILSAEDVAAVSAYYATLSPGADPKDPRP